MRGSRCSPSPIMTRASEQARSQALWSTSTLLMVLGLSAKPSAPCCWYTCTMKAVRPLASSTEPVAMKQASLTPTINREELNTVQMNFCDWYVFYLKRTCVLKTIRQSVSKNSDKIDEQLLFIVDFIYTFIYGAGVIIFEYFFSLIIIRPYVFSSVIVIVASILVSHLISRFLASALGAIILKNKIKS